MSKNRLQKVTGSENQSSTKAMTMRSICTKNKFQINLVGILNHLVGLLTQVNLPKLL